MRCFLVQQANDTVTSSATTCSEDDLPPGDVVIRVQWSSLNYKDALAAKGHRGVVKKLPHVPGIDAAGVVESSTAVNLKPGEPVLVTGYELGAERWGGWAERVRVPSPWVVPLPDGLTARTAMIYGTAGFTAAQCVQSLQEHGIGTDSGPVVVTGASGGVGSLALRLLNKLGYQVVAVSGKPGLQARLKQWGATEVLGRDDVLDTSDKPLLPTKWAAAVDTVGGQTLATLMRQLRHRGCAAACGLVGGAELPLTVYPFLLRGVTLAGIDSAWCPDRPRRAIWEKLAGPWKLDDLEEETHEVDLEQLPVQIERILRGEVAGRVLVKPGG